MVATSVLESPTTATVTEPPVQDARPDVGVIVGGDDAHQAMGVAVQKAAASGGKVCAIGYVDNTGIRSPRALIRRSAAIRSQLGRIVSQHLADNREMHVTERLHVGSLGSLLRTLEPSIGVVVLEGAQDAITHEIVSLCPVPVCIVDTTGSTITHDTASDRETRR
jgi:hypothetical protein